MALAFMPLSQQRVVFMNKLGLVILVLGSMIFSGCENNNRVVAEVNHSDAESGVRLYQTWNKIEIVQQQGNFTQGLYAGAVMVKNKSTRVQHLSYKFDWFDADGNPILLVEEPWVPFVLSSHESKGFQSIAKSPKAVRFQLNLREDKATHVFKTNFMNIY
jgi:uncharacterized protein YcfL